MSRLEHAPLAQLTLARIREFGREPEAVFWTFFFPIVLAFALGIAFRERGPERVWVGVQAGPGARALAAALQGADNLRVRVLEPAVAGEALRDGDVALVIVPGGARVTYRYDPTRPESRLARLATDDALQRAAGRRDRVAVSEEAVEERGSRYIDFLIPGLIGLNLLGTGLWGVGYTVVRMRTGKLLKRLLATPMRRSHFLLSFMLARLGFLAAELALLLFFAWVAFGVGVRGSLATLAFIAALGAFAFTGVGLLVASRARTLEGVSGLMNLAAVPMWVLSGIFFSAEHFPDVMQPFIRALPLTALVDALRAVMLDGAPLAATAGWLGIVALWGAGCFGAALAMFRWR
ncbi:MAG: ABC transporter permease [Gemmatimonadetes bacterium]|nr:ABC transporter permease [Gemmatimonadota bacterium]